MDKKINQLPAVTLPLDPTDLFLVGKLLNPGEAYNIQFSDLVSQVLLQTQNTGSKVYYVDGNSTVVGDGSVLLPFQTLDEARIKIIGTGTVDTPEHQFAGIMVATASYLTNKNLWINNTSWIFSDGSMVTYTGASHLFDSSVFPTELSGKFVVAGGAIFLTNTGGIIRNEGNVVTNNFVNNKVFEIECFQMISTKVSANPFDVPLILHRRITSNGYGPIHTNIKIKSGGTIVSYNQHCAHVIDGGTFAITGESDGENSLIYGLNYINGAYTSGVVGGRCLKYENTDATTRKYYATCNLSNFNVISINNLCEIEVTGNFNNIILRNLNFTDAGPIPTHPTYCIQVGTITESYNTNPYFIFLIDNCRAVRNPCTDPRLIRYVGAGVVQLIEIQNCTLYTGYYIDPNISPGSNSNFNQPIECLNIFDGRLNLSNIQSYTGNADAIANGLKIGDVYTVFTTGIYQLAIVQ